MCAGSSWCSREPLKFKNGRDKKYCDVCIQYKVYARNAPSRPWLFYKVHKIVFDDYFCECCGYSPSEFHPNRSLKHLAGLMDVDHINPLIKHTDEGEQPMNYQLLCKSCHILKSYDEGDYVNKRYK